MATSISTEITDSYYAVLMQYYEYYYNRQPSENEKLSIKEAAQFGKLQNSEKDYIDIYSRIHGVSAEQARDEPSGLKKLKEFIAANMHKRTPIKRGATDLSKYKPPPEFNPIANTMALLAKIESNRKPQHSYCTQEEMDKKQSKIPEKMEINKICYDVKDDDSDSTLKEFQNDQEVVEMTGKKVETTAFSPLTNVASTTTAASSTTTTTSITTATSGQIFSLDKSVKAKEHNFPTGKDANLKGKLDDSLLTCQEAEPMSPFSTGQLEHHGGNAPQINDDFYETYKPNQVKIDFLIDKCEALKRIIDQGLCEITILLRSQKIEISPSEYMGKLHELEKACYEMCHDADFLSHSFDKQGNPVEAECYHRLSMHIRDAIKNTKSDVYKQIREMPYQLKQFSLQQGFESSFSDFSEKSKEFVTFSDNNEKVPENVRMEIPGQSQKLGPVPFIGQQGTKPKLATYNYDNENTNPFIKKDRMYMKKPEETSNASVMQMGQNFDKTGFYNQGMRAHGGGPAETKPNYYSKAQMEQESLETAPQWRQTESKRFAHDNDAEKMFKQFMEFLKLKDSRPTRPHVEQPNGGYNFRAQQNNDHIPGYNPGYVLFDSKHQQPYYFPKKEQPAYQPYAQSSYQNEQRYAQPNYKQPYGQFQYDHMNQPNQHHRHSNIKLEVPSLDVSADIFEFHHFKHSFEAVMNEDQAPAIKRMNCLKNAVKKKELKDAIMNLPYDDYGYHLAMETLEERFGDIEALKMQMLVKVEQFNADTRYSNGLFQLNSLIASIIGNPCFEGELNIKSLLFTKIKTKLDHEARLGFDKEIKSDYQNLRLMGDYLKNLAKDRKNWEVTTQMNKSSQRPTFRTRHYNINSTAEKEPRHRTQRKIYKGPNCLICGKEHHIYHCLKEKKAPEVEALLKKHNLCFRCFSSKHGVADCTSQFKCQKCKGMHNTLLHDNYAKRTTVVHNNITIENNFIEPEIKDKVEKLLPTKYSAMVTPGKAKNPNSDQGQETIVYYDPGSDETWISTELSQKLNLEPEMYADVTLTTVNGKKKYHKTPFVTFELSSMDGQQKFSMTCRQMDQIPECTYKDPMKVKDEFKYLENISVYPTTARKVGICIGRDHLNLFKQEQVLEGNKNQPIAFKLPLGWSVCFPRKYDEDEDEEISCNFVRTTMNCQISQFSQSLLPIEFVKEKVDEKESLDIQTNEAMRKMLTEDNLMIEEKPPFNKDEAEAFKQVKESFKYTKDDRPEVALPFNEKVESLENNLSMSLARLNSSVLKLQKENIVKEYEEKILDGVKKDYFEEVKDKTPQFGHKHYIPTQVVIRSDRETNRIRMVNNARAEFKGLSLNATLRAGPNLQTEMPIVIIGFRKNDIAITMDVSEMFPQVIVRKEDRDMLRFLFKNPGDKNYKIYRHKRLPFGLNCSPFIAQFTVVETAKLMKDECPLGYELVMNNRYVDDILASVETVDEAKQALIEVQKIFDKCRMVLHKVLSNSEDVLLTVEQEKRLKKWQTGKELPCTKVLGMMWNPNTDMMNIICPNDEKMPTTKRSLLTTSAKLYDPQGMLSAFSILVRLLLQRLWSVQVNWDEKLPQEFQKEAQNWFNQLDMIESVKFPRKIVKSGKPIRLHVFADSSDYAYGIAIYLETEEDSGLVFAKSRVHTMKPKSIPRKELQAAVLASKTVATLKSVFPDLPVIMWTDSQNVLAWIQSDSRQYKPYINNRVSAILDHTTPEQWRWVNTSNNPADIASRGMQINQLKDCLLWWKGAVFLWNKEVVWPPLKKYLKTDEELKKNVIKEIFSNYQKLDWLPDFSQYESLDELVMATAKEKKKLDNDNDDITLEDKNEALQTLIKDAQRERFEKEIEALEHDKPIPARSSIVKLTPFLDADKILRCWTRLQDAPIPESTSKPILLPKDHDLTTKVIKKEHEKTKHAYGVDYTLSEVRKMFWIPAGRQQIKKVLKNCRQCKINFGMPRPPKMAPLPAIRLEGTMLPFTNASVDFSGAYITVQGRGKRRSKRYLCLFVCNETRAIHTEFAWNMETEGFLMCLGNFTARKGKIKTLTCDNGTNFRGAERELGQLIQQLDQNQIQQHARDNGFEFRFNPPGAPHMGGVFESLIKSAKRAIRAVLKNVEFTDAELNAAFIGAEDLVNSRPLGYQTNDINDPRVLTPNSFLHGRLDGSFLPPSVDTKEFDIKNRWRLVQQALKHIWKRWMQEILPTLGPRQKWTTDNRNFQKDDEVLIVDKNLPRYRWNIGRVTEVYPGRDGVVRVVDVRDNNGIELKKTVHRLIPLT